MAIKNKVEVKIGGVNYTIVGAETEQYIRSVSQYIDKKINEMTRINNKLSTSMASVLTAVNVADDYFKSRENEINAKNQLKDAQKEIELLKDEVKRLTELNKHTENKNSMLKLEIVKRDAEINRLNSYDDANSRQKIYIAK